MNLVVLNGRLTKSPKLEEKGNIKYCAVTIVVKKKHPTQKGRKEDFINVIAFNASAIYLSKYCSQGDLIEVIGSLSVEVYEYQGKKNVVYKVICENTSLLSKPKSNEQFEEELNKELDFQGVSEDEEDPYEEFF